MVESELMELDGIFKTVEEINRRAELQSQLHEKEDEFEDMQSKLHQTSERIIELENTMSRYQAVASGNLQENVAIAKASYAGSKVNRKRISKCHSIVCVITEYDQDPVIIMCSKCGSEFHTFFEGCSASGGILLAQDATDYTCLKCESNVITATELIDV